jgi:hypothetical protein
VNVAETGGYASTIEIATAGTGYTNGDLITVTSGTSNATFTIVMAGRNTWRFGTDGNLTLPQTGYLKVGSGIVAGFASSPAPVISGFSSVSAENFRFQGNGVNILSTVGAGAYGNTQVASYLLQFDGDIEFTSSTARIGNVDVITVGDHIRSPAYQFSNGTSILSNVVTKVSDSWTVATGTNTYSFTVPSDGTYTMWVKCNIPNGIIVWNATASVSNTNVPAIGTQYAWNYTGGGSPILLTAIPNQIRGTAGTISTDATYAGTTSNRFDFTIANTSGEAQIVYYGYTKI